MPRCPTCEERWPSLGVGGWQRVTLPFGALALHPGRGSRVGLLEEPNVSGLEWSVPASAGSPSVLQSWETAEVMCSAELVQLVSSSQTRIHADSVPQVLWVWTCFRLTTVEFPKESFLCLPERQNG